MRLVYARMRPGNFGDELNAYLWPRLLPAVLEAREDMDFIGIGTLFSQMIARAGRHKLVFGTGAGYSKAPPIDATWTIEFVRGPLTARLLGLPADRAITDSAYCLAFDEGFSLAPAGKRTVFMPHHKSEPDVDWRSLCAELDWDYASPTVDSTADVEVLLHRLRSARLVVSEAMHGAIIADLYRVPWVGVRYGFRSLDFKWQDWCASIGIDYRPLDMPPLLDAALRTRDRLERLVKRSAGIAGVGKPPWKSTPWRRTTSSMRRDALGRLRSAENRAVLSSDLAHKRNQARLWEKVSALRTRYEHRERRSIAA